MTTSSSSPIESKALAIAPKFPALLSMIASSTIVSRVLRDPDRRSKPMHRIVAGMSICDFLGSVWFFAGTLPIPTGTPSRYGGDNDNDEDGIFLAFGDPGGVSCSVSGFFTQLWIAAPLYNAFLSLYFLLVIRFGWKDRRIADIEWFFHVVPVGWGLATAAFALALDLYGSAEWTCWINPERTTYHGDPPPWLLAIEWLFLYSVLPCCILFQAAVFVVLYRTMRSLEDRMRRYAVASSTGDAVDATTTTTLSEIAGIAETIIGVGGRSRNESCDGNGGNGGSLEDGRTTTEETTREVSKSTRIALQGLLYVGAFYMTFASSFLTKIVQIVGGYRVSPFPFSILNSICIPMQGFWNFVVYTFPRFTNRRSRHRDETLLTSIKAVVFEESGIGIGIGSDDSEATSDGG